MQRIALFLLTALATNLSYGHNFSGTYKMVTDSCVEDNRKYNRFGQATDKAHVLKLLDVAKIDELYEAYLYAGEQVIVDHSTDGVKLTLKVSPEGLVTMNFVNNWGIFDNISVSDDNNET